MPVGPPDSCHSPRKTDIVPDGIDQPPSTRTDIQEQKLLNVTSSEFQARTQAGHITALPHSHAPSPLSTPSLSSDHGTPSMIHSPISPETWAGALIPTTTFSSSNKMQLDGGVTEARERANREDLYHENYRNLEQGHMNTPSVVPKPLRPSRITVERMPGHVSHPTASPSASMNPLDSHKRDLMVRPTGPGGLRTPGRSLRAPLCTSHHCVRSIARSPVARARLEGRIKHDQCSSSVWPRTPNAPNPRPPAQPTSLSQPHYHESCPSQPVPCGHAEPYSLPKCRLWGYAAHRRHHASS